MSEEEFSDAFDGDHDVMQFLIREEARLTPKKKGKFPLRPYPMHW